MVAKSSGGSKTVKILYRKPDPTKNVISLTRADVRRQDDLRKETEKRYDQALRHHHELIKIESAHNKQLRILEKQRVDARSQLDAANRSREDERSSRQIEALAKAVENTATSLAKSTADLFEGQNKRIAELERTSYKGEGKQGVIDPQVSDLMKTMTNVITHRAGDTGERRGNSQMFNIILAVVSTAAFVGGTVLAFFSR